MMKLTQFIERSPPETSSAVASVSAPVTILDAAKSAADTDTQRVHQ